MMEPVSNLPSMRKKRGRPPGSKNKNKINKSNEKKVSKTDTNYAIIPNLKVIKTEDDDKSLIKFECSFCKNIVESTDVREHINECLKNSKSGNAKYQIDIKVTRFMQAAYCCKECPKRFRFKSSYEEHIKMDHSKTPGSVSCDKCSTTCPDKEALQQHISKVHERDLYKCPTCNKNFVRRSHVMRHMAQSGCNGEGIHLYPCQICDRSFTRKDNLAAHLKIQHILKRAFSCKVCDYETKNFSKLTNHWQLKHSGTPARYECDVCGKTTGSRAAMTKHFEIHGEKKYSCDVCGYNTFTIEVMRRHVFTHLPVKPYKCNHCSNSYIQRSQLEHHLEKHKGLSCTKCNRSFSTKASLLIHEREHKGLEKLFCPFKGCFTRMEFNSESTFEAHLQKHFEEKPFVCEVCQKQFHSELNMRRHLSTHTLDRPRRCMYCVSARAYVRGIQLVRHVRKTHPKVFNDHLTHVRQVLGENVSIERVNKSELELILNVLDAEADRILQGYGGTGVLYGGMQPMDENASSSLPVQLLKKKDSPLMSEADLTESLRKLLSKLIDLDTLECFGWPEEPVDVVLEKVIVQCGARAADREKWTRVQRLRENAKHLFLYVIEDQTITKMLNTHTIDQIINHILVKVSEDDEEDQEQDPK